ncbi:MAG: tripartite tricarboxylate transporter permease [Planctomycetota bacterium]|jgi:putative tricarboxylic transport membrane protein|nr:tripartite tricarboxylate transporter permease [Planctomycetota bacterium]
MDVLTALDNVLDVYVIGMIFAGAVIGIVFGSIPGLNTPVAIALMLPFTYQMPIHASIGMIMGIYMGGISGGLISAILLRIPGTSAAIATVLDGYPMARKGQAAEALALGTFVSFVGGILSALALLGLAPLLSRFALNFGPWEYLGVSLFALSLVCTLMSGRMIKGFITVFIGLIAASVGTSPIDGRPRLTLGMPAMLSGFDLVVVIIGIYAFSEIFGLPDRMRENPQTSDFVKKWFYFPKRENIFGQIGNMIRSAVLGIIVGILPGIGATVAGMLAYGQAKRFSKYPEKFGTGIPDGLVASETANNAVTGGALIPALVLSVPGDPSTAIIIGALLIQGIQCGPLLVVQEGVLFQTIVLCVFIANIAMYLVQAGTIRWTARIVTIPKEILMPLIVVFCCLGAFTVNNRMFDLHALLFFAVLGYLLQENDYPLMPIILAYVLGPLIEQYYRRTLMYYDSFSEALFQYSFGSVFFVLSFALPVASILLNHPAVRRKLGLRQLMDPSQ